MLCPIYWFSKVLAAMPKVLVWPGGLSCAMAVVCQGALSCLPYGSQIFDKELLCIACF